MSNAVADDVVFGHHGWQSALVQKNGLSTNYNDAMDVTEADPVSGSINLKRVACEMRKLETGE